MQTQVMNVKASVTLIAAATGLLAAGCGTVQTKVVVADSATYMAQNFSAEQVPAKVRAQLEQAPPSIALFKTMHITYTIDTDVEGKNEQVAATVDLTTLGNGYVQKRSEFAKNAVPYRINLALTVGGLVFLKSQTLFLDNANGAVPLTVEELSRFDRGLLAPVAGQNYVVSMAKGAPIQIANFSANSIACTAGARTPAHLVFASVTGDASVLDCTTVGSNGAVASKTKYTWLYDYGVALEREQLNARSKSAYTVTALSVTR